MSLRLHVLGMLEDLPLIGCSLPLIKVSTVDATREGNRMILQRKAIQMNGIVFRRPVSPLKPMCRKRAVMSKEPQVIMLRHPAESNPFARVQGLHGILKRHGTGPRSPLDDMPTTHFTSRPEHWPAADEGAR